MKTARALVLSSEGLMACREYLALSIAISYRVDQCCCSTEAYVSWRCCPWDAGKSDAYRTKADEHLAVFWMYIMQVLYFKFSTPGVLLVILCFCFLNGCMCLYTLRCVSDMLWTLERQCLLNVTALDIRDCLNSKWANVFCLNHDAVMHSLFSSAPLGQLSTLGTYLQSWFQKPCWWSVWVSRNI
jgi:hypothetical protein